MICPHCDGEHPSGVVFCPNTGQKIETEIRCGNCGEILQPGWQVCAYCGYKTGDKTRDKTRESYDWYVEEPAEPKKKKRNLKWLFIVIPALLIVCVGAFILINPFGVIGRVLGTYDAAAKAMPEDTDLYVSIDLARLITADYDKLAPLAVPLEGAFAVSELIEGSGSGDFINDLEREIRNEFGISLSNDIQPWVGQYAGIGILGYDNNYGFDDSSLVLAIETRSKAKADQFLEKFAEELEDRQDMSFDTDQYNGVELYVQDDPYDSNELTFGRSDEMVIIASSLDAAEAAIDAQERDSLSNDEGFKKTLKAAPASALMTFYLNSTLLEPLFQDAEGAESILSISGLPPAYDAWQGSRISVAITNDGLQLDIISAYETDRLSTREEQVLKMAGGKNRAVEMLSEGTLAFLAGQDLGLLLEDLIGLLYDSYHYDDPGEAFRDEFGFDLEDDLIPYVGENWTFGFIRAEGDYWDEIGFSPLFIAKASDTEELLDTAEKFLDSARDNTYWEIDERDYGDGRIYILTEFEKDFLAIGIANGYLVIGPDSRAIEDILDKNSSITVSTGYKQVWKAFPNSSSPILYLDMDELDRWAQRTMGEWELRDYEEMMQYFEGAKYLAMASLPLKGDVVTTTLILFIE